MPKFRTYSHVKLNSGGPVMRVLTHKLPNIVKCDWLDGDTRVEGEFQEETLISLEKYKGHIQFRTTVTVGSGEAVNKKTRSDSVNDVMLILADLYRDADKDIVIKIKHI